MTRIKLYLLSFMLCCSVSCKKTDIGPSPVPWVKVNISIDLSKSPYNALLTPGGYVYISGGYKGIVVVCDESGKIWALDRTCPYHVNASCAVVSMASAGNQFTCPCCSSTYALDGAIGHGPSNYSLKAYIVSQYVSTLTITS